MNHPNRTKAARFLRSLSALLLSALLAAVACSDAQGSDINGETHFLKLCQDDAAACGSGLACLCGVCTRACEASSDCSAFPAAECVTPTAPASPAACGSEPVSRCDVRCDADSDCRVLTSAHRCEAGFCRAPSNSGGTAGSGAGGSGGSAGAGAGGDSAGAAGGDACARGETAGNQVVVLGDTFMALTHQVTAGIEELARAAGVLPAGERYRDESSSMNNGLAAGGILDQYAGAFADAPVAVVIMNGGGADVLGASCDEPPSAACPAIDAAATAVRELFARMAADGVEHVVYAFYPDPGDAGVRARMDALRPVVEVACAESPVPRHFRDLRPAFEGRYAEYIAPDGLNPTAAGSLAAANAIWATMQEFCVAQ